MDEGIEQCQYVYRFGVEGMSTFGQSPVTANISGTLAIRTGIEALKVWVVDSHQAGLTRDEGSIRDTIRGIAHV